MTILWRPDGQLDIATDPAALPLAKSSALTGTIGNVESSSLTRCKNLRINQNGKVVTRDGSVKLNTLSLQTPNKITNGTFDTGLSSWSTSGATHESAAMKLGQGNTGNQNVTLIVGHTYLITGKLTQVDGADAQTNIRIGRVENGDDIAEVLLRVNVGESKNYNLTFTATQTSIWVGFVGRLPGNSLVDDVVLVDEGAQKISLLIEQDGDFYTFSDVGVNRNETEIKAGLAVGQWSGFKYNSFDSSVKQIFALNGTDRKRVFANSVVEWGTDAPGTAATLAVGVTTGLTGDYKVKYTYVRKEGATIVYESNPSEASASQTLSNESLSVTVTASSDAEVTHIRIYRTIAAGDLYFVDQDIAVPATTLDSTTADADLGLEVETDHNRPPATGTVAFGPLFNGIAFIIDGPNLHYCLAKKAEYWPATHFVEVSNLQLPGITGLLWNGQPYVLTKNDIFFIQGSSHGNFFPLKMKAKTGAQSIYGAVGVRGHGIFHTGVDGIYLFANGRDTKITEPRLEPIFRKAKGGEPTTLGTMPRVARMDNAILHQFFNQLFFCYSSTATGNPDNVIVLNLDTNRIVHHVYNDGKDIKITAMHSDQANQRLIVADDTGFVRHIEKSDAADDSGTAISFDVQSMEFTLQTRKHYPRWVKYDIDGSIDGASVTGELYLDGVLHQSHTITKNRRTTRRLVKTGNGNRQAHRIHGSGQVTIHVVEAE